MGMAYILPAEYEIHRIVFVSHVRRLLPLLDVKAASQGRSAPWRLRLYE